MTNYFTNYLTGKVALGNCKAEQKEVQTAAASENNISTDALALIQQQNDDFAEMKRSLLETQMKIQERLGKCMI